MTRTLLIACLALVIAGCVNSASRPASKLVVQAASEQQKAALFDRIKSLAGTWEMADEKGKYEVASVFTVSSKDSAVREIMFPGTPFEMTNMYHMDGPSLVVTHYCAEGNQPRMRAAAGQADRIVFTFDSVANLTDGAKGYMGQLTIVFKDADHIRQEWCSLKDGKPVGHANFDLRRKKGS